MRDGQNPVVGQSQQLAVKPLLQALGGLRGHARLISRRRLYGFRRGGVHTIELFPRVGVVQVQRDRRNVISIADEAHRSQYDFIDGFARHMRDALPHASFIGYPPDKQERATPHRIGASGGPFGWVGDGLNQILLAFVLAVK